MIFVIYLLLVAFSIILSENIDEINGESQKSFAELEKIRNIFQREINKDENSQCKWNSVRSSIDAFQDDETWRNYPQSPRLPVLLHTSCFGTDSLGNSLSEYIETRLCADQMRMHYVDLSLRNGESEFFRTFPSIVVHPNPRPVEEAKSTIRQVCECASICHEWGYGLMHKHMHLAKKIFKDAIDSYWSKRSYANAWLPLDSKTLTVCNRPDSSPLPFIPDAAIHYRCGDNLVTHYGFLKFHVFAKFIPADAKTIYVMAEYPGRNAKLNSESRCSAIFDALGVYLRKHFSSAAIVIMRGNNVFDDLVRLTKAKTLICSTSTFCFWPAIANEHAAYFPLTKLIAKEETHFDYGANFHWLSDPKDRQILGKNAAHMNDKMLVRLLDD